MAPSVRATAGEPSYELDRWFPSEGWDWPGVIVASHSLARNEAESEEQVLEWASVYWSRECEEPKAFDYDDGTYSVRAEVWTGCGPDRAGELVIGITIGEGEWVSVDVRLLTQADIDAATRIIETLSLKPTVE